MPRRRTPISDAQAREIAVACNSLEAAHSRRENRPFLDALVPQLHHILGRLPSVSETRMLLAAHSPSRGPSGDTINAALRGYERQLAPVGADDSALDGRARAADSSAATAAAQLTGKVHGLQALVEELKAELRDERATASRHRDRCAAANERCAQLQTLCEERERELIRVMQHLGELRNRVEALEAKIDAGTQALNRAMTEMEAARRRSIIEIDNARSEGRVWKQQYESAAADVAQLRSVLGELTSLRSAVLDAINRRAQ